MVQFVSYLRRVLSKICLIFSCINGPIMEVITPKKDVFCFSHFDIFGGNMSSQNSCQILFLKEVTTRTSKVKTFLKYAYLFKRYSFLKGQFSTILLLKITQNGGKFKLQNATSFDWIGIIQKCFDF